VRAIDTNIVIRLLMGDDDDQSRRARAVVQGGDIFIATTVLLESEWVLRSGFGLRPTEIREALELLAGLAGVTVEEPARLAQALDWMADGMDFADALHLAKARDCTAFLTFDRRLIAAAAGRSPVRAEEPGP
jgi:predicted nucleic-acid-binding protein